MANANARIPPALNVDCRWGRLPERGVCSEQTFAIRNCTRPFHLVVFVKAGIDDSTPSVLSHKVYGSENGAIGFQPCVFSGGRSSDDCPCNVQHNTTVAEHLDFETRALLCKHEQRIR